MLPSTVSAYNSGDIFYGAYHVAMLFPVRICDDPLHPICYFDVTTVTTSDNIMGSPGPERVFDQYQFIADNDHANTWGIRNVQSGTYASNVRYAQTAFNCIGAGDHYGFCDWSSTFKDVLGGAPYSMTFTTSVTTVYSIAFITPSLSPISFVATA
jgi:hypothetical protein